MASELLDLLLPSNPVLFLKRVLTASPGAPHLLTPAITLALTSGLILLLTYGFQHLILRPYFSPLYDLPGPPRTSIIFGNLKRIFTEEPGKVHDEWAEKYGGVVRYGGAYGDTRLMFTDPVALNHILLARSYDYPKPNEVRGNLSRILGKGILFAEGEDHKRQKRIMSPAFAPSHLKALTPTFFAISYKLRDRWTELISNDAMDLGAWKDEAAAKEYQSTKPGGEVVFDVTKWLSRVTLDIIGVAGFGYEFNALDKEENKLAGAFASMMPSPAARPSVYRLLIQQILGKIITRFPIAQRIPNKTIQAVRKGFATMESESQLIIEEKKREVAESGGVGGGKDLMTLLLKSNLGEGKAVMTDAELQGQMTTFILAGHETTSTALTWTLWMLARHPTIQDRLRKEVRAARAAAKEEGRSELGSEELNSLEYLDAVTREILRLESPVTATIRSAGKDDLVPLSKPITTPSGRTLSSIPVQAGQVLFISITAINKSTSVFGSDANEFRPERWLDGSVGSEEGKSVGVYSHLLTFLAGPRACIGYKFAILELKAILTVLIDDFSFSERSPDLAIERRSAIVMRPLVVGEESMGNRMPLRVCLARRDD